MGAGSAGTMVARQLLKNNDADLYQSALSTTIDVNKIWIFMDSSIGGIQFAIERIVKKLDIENIIIAIPSLSKKEFNIIFQECAKTKAKTQILPMLEDLVTGKISVNQFRDVKVEDLLGREPVKLDIDIISDSFQTKLFW